jgi:hypothetical protein
MIKEDGIVDLMAIDLAVGGKRGAASLTEMELLYVFRILRSRHVPVSEIAAKLGLKEVESFRLMEALRAGKLDEAMGSVEDRDVDWFTYRVHVRSHAQTCPYRDAACTGRHDASLGKMYTCPSAWSRKRQGQNVRRSASGQTRKTVAKMTEAQVSLKRSRDNAYYARKRSA